MMVQRDTIESLKEHGVYVVLRERYHGHSETVAVVTNMDAATAAVIDDGDFWHDGNPVLSGDREIWGKCATWIDPYARNWESGKFSREQGRMIFVWKEGEPAEETYADYYVQWRPLALRFA